MTPENVIDVVSEAITRAKNDGMTAIPSENLLAFLAHVKSELPKAGAARSMTEFEIEEFKAKQSKWLDDHKRAHERGIEMLRAVITVGQSALKSALLINGGATVAMLAFLGNLWKVGTAAVIFSQLACPTFLYALGVLAGAMAAGATYFSQAGYSEEFGKNSLRIGRCGHVMAVLLVFTAYGLFLYATIDAASTLRSTLP